MRKESNKNTPLVLIDIDGVANIFGAEVIQAHQRQTRIGRYRIVLDNRHPAWFAEIGEYAEMRWSSMWQANAVRDFAPEAGFGHTWAHLAFDAWYAEQPMHVIRQARQGQMTGNGIGSFKDPIIREVAESGRPMVVIDDDLTDDQILWAVKRSQTVAPTLFVRPDPEHGFTRAQYRRVLAFVQTYSMEREMAS